MNDIIDTLDAVEARIVAACMRVNRSREEVNLIAVTKTHGADVVRDAIDAGLTVFGENKVQEATWKIPMSPANAQWHLIGHLQSNKARAAVRLFKVIHAVDSIKLYDLLVNQAELAGTRPEIYLEVNVSGEPSKYGITPDQLPIVLEHVLPQALTVSGLMTMAPFHPDPEAARPHFATLRKLRDQMEKQFDVTLPHLSMGMTGDFEVAIEEGATDIRIGSALFGQRPKVKMGANPFPEIIYD